MTLDKVASQPLVNKYLRFFEYLDCLRFNEAFL
jgi:hypothetical protein